MTNDELRMTSGRGVKMTNDDLRIANLSSMVQNNSTFDIRNSTFLKGVQEIEDPELVVNSTFGWSVEPSFGRVRAV